jgi:hypothetical protein
MLERARECAESAAAAAENVLALCRALPGQESAPVCFRLPRIASAGRLRAGLAATIPREMV